MTTLFGRSVPDTARSAPAQVSPVYILFIFLNTTHDLFIYLLSFVLTKCQFMIKLSELSLMGMFTFNQLRNRAASLEQISSVMSRNPKQLFVLCFLTV